MSILSDKDIKKKLKDKEIIINPYNEEDLQPSSVDLHLGDDLKTIQGVEYVLTDTSYLILEPDDFILGSTLEYVEIPNDLVGIVEGRSSLGRLGITAHITARYIDPGFKGNITLEMTNVSDEDFILRRGMNICQIIFETLSSPCEHPYGDSVLNSKYQNSKGTVISKYKY